MPNNQKAVLAKNRLDRAKETYLTAYENLENQRFLDANNRAYYSIFHSMRAILALDGVDFKKHTGVISYFRENYIKTGVFEDQLSDIITKASIIRGKSDYEDFYLATKEEAEEQAFNAKLFFEAIEEYIRGVIHE